MILRALGFAVVVATILAACAQRDPALSGVEPKPSHVVDQYTVPSTSNFNGVGITEFRDSLGRACVLAINSSGQGSMAMDCGYHISFNESAPE